MGLVSHFPVDDIKNRYGLEIAIETGTAYAEGTKYLASIFKKVYTVELLEYVFNANKPLFESLPNVEALHGSSADMLPEVLKQNTNTPTLFWLDAHLPSLKNPGLGWRGGDASGGSIGNIDQGVPQWCEPEIEFPLQKEFELIINGKDISKDVIIVDDLNHYDHGPDLDCPGIVWEASHCEDHRDTIGTKFVYDLFQETHRIAKDYSGQGYLFLEPLPGGMLDDVDGYDLHL